MCFHSKQTKSAQEVQNRFEALLDDINEFKTASHYNGFEHPKTPVILDENPKIITHFSWGLIPSWAKDDEIKKLTLNGRIETIEEKPAFRNSINKRCLVIANGFYDWQWLDSKGKNKVKYEIGISNEELFTYAGLYSEWVDTLSGEIRKTYTIVSTDANELMSVINNNKKRMPVVLKPEDEKKWLEHYPIKEFALPYQVHLIAKNIDENLRLF